MEIAVVAGFAAFLGKYLEQQFNLTTSSANQLLGRRVMILFKWREYSVLQSKHVTYYSTYFRGSCGRHWTSVSLPPPGMTAIPCACLGIFLGGLLVKKLNLSALGAVRMAMLVNLVSTACYVSFLFLGCDNGPVAGVTVAYSNE